MSGHSRAIQCLIPLDADTMDPIQLYDIPSMARRCSLVACWSSHVRAGEWQLQQLSSRHWQGQHCFNEGGWG
jgi:hypothetical protein